MGSIISGVTDAIGLTDSKAGERAAEQSREAASTAAAGQKEALDYLKQQSALPTEFRDKALQKYGDIFLGGGVQAPTQEQIQANPLYQSILGAQGQAEEAVLRRGAATGGFRGGDTQVGLARTAADIGRQATLAGYQDELSRQQYNIGGLQSLAQLPTGANQIAGLTSGIGQTLAQGQTAAAQAQLTGSQQNISNLLGLGQLGIGAGLAFSDERLKSDVVMIRNTPHPDIHYYGWKWNDIANGLGLIGADKGYLAGEINSVWPELVKIDESSYMKINKEEIENRLQEMSNV